MLEIIRKPVNPITPAMTHAGRLSPAITNDDTKSPPAGHGSPWNGPGTCTTLKRASLRATHSAKKLAITTPMIWRLLTETSYSRIDGATPKLTRSARLSNSSPN